MYRYVPLAAAVALLCAFIAVPFSDRLDDLLGWAAFRLFGGADIDPDPRRERLLRSAGIGEPYRGYATRTYLYLFGAALAGSLVGVYAGTGVLALVTSLEIQVTGPTIPGAERLSTEFTVPPPLGVGSLDTSVFDTGIFGALLAASALGGLLAATVAYGVRWYGPSLRADTRRRQIDAGMPRMVAFVYALTRGGMAFPDVMRALSRNEEVFGEAAAEMSTGVRSIDLFNVDLVTAVQDLSQRTPSEQFEKFTENLTSVLQSGRNVSEFLRQEYERYREEAEEQQAEILELLATTAEIYVTTVVAGMLFLVTILLIIGLTAGDTLFIIQLITYVVLPVGNLLFLAYLSEVTQPLRASGNSRRMLVEDERGPALPDSVRTDGGYLGGTAAANLGRLRAYERVRSLRETVASPIGAAIARPTRVLYVVVPIVVLVSVARLPSAFVDGSLDVRVLDDILVQGVLVVLASFAVVYEVGKRRLRRLEEAVPDLLERLASLNEAGIAVVSSLDRVRRSDVGALDEEVDRIWRDIRWGATVAQALDRFEERVRTPAVTRVVTLLTNAMRASNEIGPVLRIAAEQARSDRRLRRQRRQEMFTYVTVIYVSFVVFLVVIAALDFVLIPNLPDPSAVGGEVAGQQDLPFASFEGGDRDAYRLVFFHTAMLQAFLSGLVAGQMGGGTVKDGAKHAAAMLGITYLVLTLL